MYKKDFRTVKLIILLSTTLILMTILTACTSPSPNSDEPFKEKESYFTETTIINSTTVVTNNQLVYNDDTTTIVSTSSNSDYDCEKIMINTQFNEQKGFVAKEISSDERNEIILLLNRLKLSLIDKPQSNQFPIGGGITMYCYNNNSVEKYIFYTKDIIEYNGNYYKGDSTSYNNLISLCSEILYNY